MNKLLVITALSFMLTIGCGPGDEGGDNPAPTPTPDVNVSDSLIDAHSAPDGPVDFLIQDILVTYLRPAAGSQSSGFHVQESPTGPALWIDIDRLALTPAPAPGDIVSFRVTELISVGGGQRASAIAGYGLSSSGTDVSAYLQDVSFAIDLVTASASYASEYLILTVTPSTFESAAQPWISAENSITTGGISINLVFTETLYNALPFTMGETITVKGVLRDATLAPVFTVFHESDVTFSSLDVSYATPGQDLESVAIVFNKPIDPASVSADGSQFSIDQGLSVVSAVVNGSSVVLTTDAMTYSTNYTVNVASTIATMLAGQGHELGTATVDFTTPSDPNAPITLVINEVDYDQNGTDNNEYVEIYNPTAQPQTLVGVDLVLVNGNNGMEYSRVALDQAGNILGAGEYLVVKSPSLAVAPGILTVDFTQESNNIQNGAPDGIGILDTLVISPS